MGKSTVDNSARLFLFPGGGHCSGGQGPFRVDFLSALISWVENAQAPKKLIASHLPSDSAPHTGPPPMGENPQYPHVQTEMPDRTRPVFPYPLTAKYIGTGSTDDAKNFVAGPPSPAPASMLKEWLGSPYYAPHSELWCTGGGTAMTCKPTP